MLKRNIYITGLCLFFGAFIITSFARTALGATEDSKTDDGSDCNLFTCPKPQLNIPDANWSDVFGILPDVDDPKKDYLKKVGKDLYKTIYAMTNVLPERKAFKNTAGSFGTTEANMVLLLNNNFSPILERSPNFTQEQALKKMLEIQQQFAEERDLLDLQADVKATVEPNEIFMNGDIADSGFDLVNDLNNIENILFKKIDPIDIGGEYDEEGKETASKESKSEALDGSGDAAAFTGLVSEKSKPDSTGVTVLPLKKTDDSVITPTISSASPSSFDVQSNAGNVCLIENNLTKALTAFRQSQEKDSRFKETATEKIDDSKDPTVKKTGATKDPSDKPKDTSAPPEFEYRELPTGAKATNVKPAPASKWLKELPCNEIFCLKINYVTKPVTAKYRDHDNCIACHIEKINTKLKETINRSLVPAKATGNLLEPGVCKAATADLFNSVGLRFHAIAKPVLTPTNDDLIYGSSVFDEWEKFVNTYKPLPFYEKSAATKKSTDSDEAPDKEIEKTASKTLTQVGPETAQREVIEKISKQIEGTARERAKEIGIAEVAIKSDVDSGFYQAIQRELEQMNAYFESFRTILESLHKKDAGVSGACESLKSKKECT